MAINLTSCDQVPTQIIRRLQDLESVFTEHEFLEGVLAVDTLYQTTVELNALCLREGVIGYHYTRAIKKDIETVGLQCTNCVTHQRSFMLKHGDRFSDVQRRRIQQHWNDYFDATQMRVRDGRVWFNFTLAALHDGGADPLLAYFGGETIYMPLKRDVEVASILQTIGQPLVIECILATDNLHTFSEHPWGRIWLSTYHTTINPDSHQCDVDAYIRERLPPTRIASINVVEVLPTR